MNEEIKFDLSQFYPMKAVIEQILGRDEFLKLKDYGSLSTWKKASLKLLDAIKLSIITTIQVCDDDWREEVDAEIKRGKKAVKGSKSITGLFADLAATIVGLTFLQIGFLPNRYSEASIRLVPANWKLDVFRTVQYVQTDSQKQRLKRYKESKKIKEAQ